MNWSKFEDDVEIYALVLKGTVDVQGLVAIKYDEFAKAVHIEWACTAPWNNKVECETQRYQGVGGHLFAIAAELSLQRGYEGYLFGEASNADVLQHYIDKFQAFPLGVSGSQYRFMIDGENTQKLMEVYNYEWTEEKL